MRVKRIVQAESGLIVYYRVGTDERFLFLPEADLVGLTLAQIKTLPNKGLTRIPAYLVRLVNVRTF